MRRTRYAAAILALVAVGASSCLAGKVTTDPNSNGAKPAESVQTDVDPRLAKPVTYQGGYKRLHYAIEDLAAQTGVAIRCGANNQDWQVRDLPMAFAAHDMPLGKLLETIAGAANLELVAESIKGDTGQTERAYRLSLSSRSRNALDSYLTNKRQTAVDRQSQLWDAVAANADIPDSDFTASGVSAKEARDLAKILKELGPDAKAKVLAGQKVDLNTHDFAKPDLLRDYFRAAGEQYATAFQGNGPPTEADIDACTLGIVSTDNAATGNFNIEIRPVLHSGNNTFGPYQSLDTAADHAWGSTKGHDSPSILAAKVPDQKLPDHLSKDLIPLDIKTGATTPPAFMSKKISLDFPKDRDVTYAEVIAAAAKETGLTIIAEDYLDHRRRSNMVVRSTMGGGKFMLVGQPIVVNKGAVPAGKTPGVKPDMMAAGAQPNPPFSPVGELGKEASVGEILRVLTKGDYGPARFEWFYDEKQKLLVARPPDWIVKHNNLMPESLLVDLKNKANGNGIELDDLAKLMAYTISQVSDWVWQSKDLQFIASTRPSPPSDSLWEFYDKLTVDDKMLARSDAGLPLAKYDTAWVADFVKSGVDSDRVIRMYGGTDEDIRKQKEQIAKRTALLTDPEAVRALTLKITKEPARKPSTVGGATMVPGADKTADSEDGYTYRPELVGQYKGESIDLRLDALYPAFPIYSPEREAKLAAKQDKKVKP